MATKQRLTLSLFSFLALILTINGADVAAPAPSVDCMSTLMNMADCLTFAESGSTVAKPEKGCCAGLEMVVKQDVVCLCQLFSNSQELGITLDVQKALSLPSICKVKTPPFSQCNITLPGVSSPATSVSSPATAPASASLPPTISPGSAPPPSKSMAAMQFKALPFTTIMIVIFVSMLIVRSSA